MELEADPPVTARAKFDFEGKNNDELSFGKNDLITITQQEDGGWWEGTIGGQTGWFPSNYVTILSEKDKLTRSRSVPNASAREIVAVVNTHRDGALQIFTDSEKTYVENLQKTSETLLVPISKAKIMNENDYSILVGNFDELISTHKTLLISVETEKRQDLIKQRVGAVFLRHAAEFRTIHLNYAENHPKAVEVLKEKQSELEKIANENNRDYKDLVSGLSEPIRHIEKYFTMLQELESIVPENHADRGDLQRSSAFYKETMDICKTTRRQKEAQLDFLYVSKIESIVPFTERGVILFVGVATVKNAKEDQVDRFVALFSRYIMFFEVTSDMGYQLKDKYTLNGFNVAKVDNSLITLERKNVGEISLTVVSTGGEADRWMAAFSKAESVNVVTAAPIAILRRPSKSSGDSMNQSQSQLLTKPPHPPQTQFPEMITRRKSSKNIDDSSDMKFDHDLQMVLPEGFRLPSSSRNSKNHPDIIQFSQLPSHFLSGNSGKRNEKGFRMRKDIARDEEIEFDTLKILEGYCVETSGHSDYHQSIENHQPHLIVAEDEKILVEEMIGDEVVFQEKSIVDAVYSIKDQLSLLQSEFQRLSKALESEQKARRRLEHNLLKVTGVMSPDGSSSTPRREVNSFDS